MKLFILLLILPCLSHAHGEDVPGPHNGHIQMPGAFHTELVWSPGKDIEIFLLDINFENATTKNSTLQVEIRDNTQVTNLECKSLADHFRCATKGKVMTRSQIVIRATRDGAPGNEAIYQLPLKKFKSASNRHSEQHSGHH